VVAQINAAEVIADMDANAVGKRATEWTPRSSEGARTVERHGRDFLDVSAWT